MQLQKYSDVTAERAGDTYRSGKSWMQPLLPMPNDKGSSSRSDRREPFTTIDDLVQKSQELFVGLRKLSDFKYPLEIRRGIRKGVEKSMSTDRQSLQIKAGGRTYFLDIEKTTKGKPYLRITESRKGEGDKWERNSINVFPENAKEFAEAISEMITRLD